jgi:hypothetical protein
VLNLKFRLQNLGDADLVAMSGLDNIRADETQEYQNRQYTEEQNRDHESLPSSSR